MKPRLARKVFEIVGLIEHEVQAVDHNITFEHPKSARYHKKRLKELKKELKEL